MNLSNKEVGRRVAAARILRGYDRRPDLAEKMQDEELAPSRLGRIERGEAKLLKPYREKLAAFLELPEAWFSEPLEAVIPWDGPKPGQLDRIEDQLEAMGDVLFADVPRAPKGGENPGHEESPPANEGTDREDDRRADEEGGR